MTSPVKLLTFDYRNLLSQAQESIKDAYAPYSNFPVSAAVIDDMGRIFTGTNIENASYGLTICAERVAIFSAISNGAKSIKAVAIYTPNSNPIYPCGACRQVMSEFCDKDATVVMDSGKESIITIPFELLLPNAFTISDLKKT